MAPRPESAHPGWPLPVRPQDWETTPTAVQASVHPLQDERTQRRERVEALEARLTQHAMTSPRPPSSDSPSQKPRHRTPTAPSRKAGGQPGQPGHRQVLLPPTMVQEVQPERCACGHTTCALTTPSPTPQVLELPPLAMEGTPWALSSHSAPFFVVLKQFWQSLLKRGEDELSTNYFR
jgi:hypothetical protein